MENALVKEFIDEGILYLQASSKTAVTRWEQYFNVRLLAARDNDVNQQTQSGQVGFEVCYLILQQLVPQNLGNLGIFILAANSLKSICSKTPFSLETMQRLLSLIDYLFSEVGLSVSHPIIEQLALAIVSIHMHRLYFHIGERYMSVQIDINSLSSEVFQEIQSFILKSLEPVKSSQLQVFILQRFGEYFSWREMKYWMSLSLDPSNTTNLPSSVKASLGKTKIDLMNKAQLALLTSASSVFPYLVESCGQSDSLSFYVFQMGKEWLQSYVTMELFTEPQESNVEVNKGKKTKVPVPPTTVSSRPLSTAQILPLLEFWLSNPLTRKAWLLIKSQDTHEVALEYIEGNIELIYQLLQYSQFRKIFQDDYDRSQFEDQFKGLISLLHNYIESLSQNISEYSQRLSQTGFASLGEFMTLLHPFYRMLSTSSTYLYSILFEFIQLETIISPESPQLRGVLLHFNQHLQEFSTILTNLYQTNSIHITEIESVELLFEVMEYLMQIYLSMTSVFYGTTGETIVIPPSTLFHSLHSLLEMWIQFSNLSYLRLETSKSLLEEKLEIVNSYRGTLRDFLRDLHYPRLLHDLIMINQQVIQEYLVSYRQYSNSADNLMGYWLEACLHAFCSICKDKCNMKLLTTEQIQEIQQFILPLWQQLVCEELVAHRLVCRMNVMILSELMKFFLDSQRLLSEECYQSSGLLSLYSQSYRVIYHSLQHAECFISPRYLLQMIPFRLKQDHIGAVAFQKSLDYCIQLLHHKPSSPPLHHDEGRWRLEEKVLLAVFPSQSFVSLLQDISRNLRLQLNTTGFVTTTPSLDERLLALSNSSHQGSPSSSFLGEVCSLFIFYCVQYSKIEHPNQGLPMQWCSFSIFAHAIINYLCRAYTYHQEYSQPLYWIVLSPTMIACLETVHSQVNHDSWRQLLYSFLLPTGTENSTLDHLYLDYLVELLKDHCSLRVMLSIITEMINSLSESFLLSTEISSFAPYYQTAHILMKWLGILISSVGDLRDGSDLFDELIDRISIYCERLLSQASRKQLNNDSHGILNGSLLELNQLLCQKCLQEFYPTFHQYLQQYFSHQLCLKRSTNSFFRLLITIRSQVLLSLPSSHSSEALIAIQQIIQDLFSHFSSLGIAAVQSDQQSAHLSSVSPTPLNVFAIGLERENKKSQLRMRSLQQAYQHNLFVLLKFWLLSMDYFIPTTAIASSTTLPSATGTSPVAFSSDPSLEFLWQQIDKSMIVHVIQIICDALILSSTAALASTSSPSSSCVLSKEIWRLMIQVLHVSVGRCVAQNNRESHDASLAGNGSTRNRSIECRCVDLSDRKSICAEVGPITALSASSSYSQWLVETGMRELIIRTIFYCLLLSATPFTSLLSLPANSPDSSNASFQPSLPAYIREQAIAILEHLYFLYGANTCTNLLLQAIPEYCNRYYVVMLSRREGITLSEASLQSKVASQQLTLSTTQLFAAAMVGDWKRFKSIIKLLCR